MTTKSISPFAEAAQPNTDRLDLASLQQTASWLYAGLLWLFVPVVAATAWLHDQNAVAAGLAAAGLALAGTAVVKFWGAQKALTHYSLAIALVGVVSIAVAMASGPWQIDFHMLYFAMLAVLVVFCDWRVILVGAAATAVHHLSLNFVLPLAVFPDGADFSRVVFHAAVVIFQTAVLAWLAHKLGALFAERSRLQALSETAREEAAANLAVQLEQAVAGKLDDIETVRQAMQRHSENVLEHAAQAENQVGEASEVASTAAGTIASGTAAVDELVRAINEVSGQFQATTDVASMAATRSRETTERVQSLDQSANNISEIVELISGIAEQTNLLALNATIEAARAGEAGKGFAVVAQEVKSLAAQTASATAEISNRIEEMQQSTKDTVTAINEIGDVITQIDGTAANVSTAIAQQNASTQSIGELMEQASDAARQIARTITQVSESAEATKEAASGLAETAGGAADHSRELNDTIGRIAQDIRASA